MSTRAELSLAESGQATGHILVVDDDQRNRFLLRDLLEVEGHEISEAADGAEALDRIRSGRFDLVLLDVNMPSMDGFEVTRRLRADPVTAALPVLLVTSLNQREQRLEGIAAGANDYLVKPIDPVELRLRVRNALHLRRLHTELARRFDELRGLEQLRDGLVHMIVHDLRSPLTGLIAYLHLLQLELEEVEAGASAMATVEDARTVADGLVRMVTNVLDVNRLEVGAMPLKRERCSVSELATAAVTSLGGAAVRDRIVVNAPAPIWIDADAGLIRRVLVNLLANALRFSPKDRPVVVTCAEGEREVRVTIADQGPGIPPQFHALIFEKFGQVEAKENQVFVSTGLGLTFCRLAVQAHGGTIGVASEPGNGSTFWFTLPRARAPAPEPNRASAEASHAG